MVMKKKLIIKKLPQDGLAFGLKKLREEIDSKAEIVRLEKLEFRVTKIELALVSK